MLSISNLSKSYGDQSLFKGITCNVGVRDRIAVIGPNGCGKTTLFEIIAGGISPDVGGISLRKGTTIGYLRQDIMPSSARSLLEDVANASTQVTGLAHRIRVLQEELAEGVGAENSRGLLNELGDLQHRFEAAGGYNAEHEAKIILSGLGFAESDFQRLLSEFSGGWLMRASLAKLLLLNPDVLLLDEPTNHLDLESCLWFEDYLRAYQGAVMVTSHDRAFMNRIARTVLAIERDEIIIHQGNYDSFVEARQRDIQVREATFKRQEQKVKKEMRFIERFRAKNTKASQVQSRLTRLGKMERVVVPRTTKSMTLSFPEPARSGEVVIALSHVGKSYDDNVVYTDLNLDLHRGDRVALVGPNGAGKTTLLKLLAGVLQFEKGNITFGHNVELSYYAQYQLELLVPENTVLAEMRRVAGDESEQKLRGILGAFLFSGDDVEKKVSVLSGGEKSRLAIAKMLIRPANFILMDEPTNHLDIPSREVLTDALGFYKGTLCFITHDRTLIRQIANKIIEVRDGCLRVFPGDYDGFLAWQQSVGSDDAELSTGTISAMSTEPVVRNKLRQRKRDEGELRNKYYQDIAPVRKRIVEIEEELARLETEIREIEERLSDPDHYIDSLKAIETTKRHREIRGTIDALIEEWERLSIEAERLKLQFEDAKASI